MPHDDFEIEPVPGLPEVPPQGEEILWQGKPDWWALSRDSLSLGWVAGYFVFLAAWRLVTVIDQMPIGQAIGAAVPFLILGAVVIGMLVLVGVTQAMTTVYTVTNRRVAMRIGAALNVTLNLPYTQIANISHKPGKGDTGTIAFEPMGDVPISYIMCWPHVRPWKMRPVQPALRCIPEAGKVARLIAQSAEARVSEPRVSYASAGARPVAAE